MLFADRRAAGQVLAHRLGAYARRPATVVLALPRGGVPVAAEVAHLLDLPLDVFVVRKLGCPGNEELAIGAIASGGVQVLNVEILAELNCSRLEVGAVVAREAEELARGERAYRGDRPPLDLAKKTVILVDDGLATGASMSAGVIALRRLGVAKTVVAIPVGPPATCAKLRGLAEEVICPYEPLDFTSVGQFYEDFRQTSDEEVTALLAG